MDAWYAMNCTIMKTIEYPLMATTLSRAQLDTVMSPILTAALPKAGIQRHMPRAIVHGSHNVQGHEVHHPAATQTIQHVQAIMRHGVRMTMTGPLLRSLMEEHILEVGSSTPFLATSLRQVGPALHLDMDDTHMEGSLASGNDALLTTPSNSSPATA